MLTLVVIETVTVPGIGVAVLCVRIFMLRFESHLKENLYLQMFLILIG